MTRREAAGFQLLWRSGSSGSGRTLGRLGATLVRSMEIWALILLRAAHITAGVAWVGFAFVFAGFIAPIARSRGLEEGSTFLNAVLDHRWFSIYISSVEGIAVLTGGLLYWNSSGGFESGWIVSPTGLAFGAGGLAGFAALIVSIGISRTLSILYHLAEGSAMESDEHASRLARFQELHRTLASLNRVYAGLLLVTVIAMAAARYL